MNIIKENVVSIEDPSNDILVFCKSQLQLENPKFFMNEKLGISNFATSKVLQYYTYDKDSNTLYVPIGFWEKHFHSVKTEDRRAAHPSKEISKLQRNYTLRPDQLQAVEAMEKHTNGILSAPTGCHAKGTNILMFDGTWKSVELIKVGDIVMGWDSTPRLVTTLFYGKDILYSIRTTKKRTFRVNKDHVLTLRNTETKKIKDVVLKDYLLWSKTQKHLWKLFSIGIDYPKKSLNIPPYILGILLGDGSIKRSSIGITTNDKEIVDVINNYASKNKLLIRKSDSNGTRCPQYFFRKMYKKSPNVLKENLDLLGLFGTSCGDKFIPSKYKSSSLKDRLELLAGILDTDGHLSSGCFDFISKSRQLALDVQEVAQSCGFYSKFTPCFKSSQNGTEHIYFRLTICGNIETIPTRIPRKKGSIRNQKKNVLNYGFTVIPGKEVEEYYGFSITGDQRYIIDNFIVTHNSGKTLCAIELIKRIAQKTIYLVHTKELAAQFLCRLKEFLSYDAGLIGTGKFEVKDISVCILQTLMRLPQEKIDILNETYGYMIGDEIHICAADEFFQAVSKLKAKWKHGCSATPERADGKTEVIVFATGPIRHSITLEEVKEHLCFPRIEFVDSQFDFPIFNSREYSRLLDYMARDAERNELIIEQRNKYPNKTCVILCQRIAHMEFLQTMIPNSRVLHSGLKTSIRKDILSNFSKGEFNTLISSYGLLSTGIDEKKIDLLIFAAPSNSKIIIKQSIGRSMRKDKDKEAIIIDIIDKKIGMLLGMSRNRKKWYKIYIELEKQQSQGIKL